MKESDMLFKEATDYVDKRGFGYSTKYWLLQPKLD